MVIGFDCIPQMAEEANYPRRKQMWIMLAAVFISEILFALICFANAGMKQASWIMEQIVVSPEIARELAGDIPAAIMNIAGLAATLTCLNGFMLAASRVVFAMGRARVLPPVFARTNKYNIPYVSVWSVFIVCVLLVLIGGEAWLETLFIAAAFATGIVYTLSALSAVAMPGGMGMGILATIIGVAITVAVAFGMPVRSWILFGVWIVIGLGVFTWMASVRKARPDYREVVLTPDDITDADPATSSG